jgi:hypothetical protein
MSVEKRARSNHAHAIDVLSLDGLIHICFFAVAEDQARGNFQRLATGRYRPLPPVLSHRPFPVQSQWLVDCIEACARSGVA